MVTDPSRSFAVTVDFCMPWGGAGFGGGQSIKLNGVNISGSFTVGGGPGQTVDCDVLERWTGTVTLDAAPEVGQVVHAEVCDAYSNCGMDDVHPTLPLKHRAVSVASAAVFTTVRPSSGNSQAFTIRNRGDAATSYSLAAHCGGGASSCSLSSSSASIAAGSATAVTVSYTASATVNDTGVVRVVASDDNDGAIVDSAWTFTTVTAARSPSGVIARDLANVTRSRCVTASAGEGAAMECGDLRIVHPLPPVTTLGKVRVPTLIYSSQQGRPIPVVPIEITMPPPPDTLPNSIYDGVIVDTLSPPAYSGVWIGAGAYYSTNWGAPGNTRRVAVSTDVSAYTTSLQHYFLCIDWTPGCYYYPQGTMAIVDRSGSNFGAGWWLAGLEELYFPDTSTILWVGGDGSTRVYSKINSTTFKAPNVDRPDSITVSGATYTRWGPEKLRVQFNASGLHTSTTNRLSEVTTFSYVSGTRKLSTLSVPVRSGSALVYSFYYDGNNILDSVVAPNAGAARKTSLARNGSQITSITDPDGSIVRFTYASGADAYRINSRIDRRSDTTTFSYNAVNQLTQSSLSMGSGQYITHQFRPVESQDIGGVYPLDSAYTLLTDPNGNETKVWTNLYGAPTRIRSADGRETRLSYDTNWPGLVSDIRTPSGLHTVAYYHSSTGLLDSTTAINPLGTGSNATTRFAWDATWQLPTSITDPTGVSATNSYDSGTGNRTASSSNGVSATFSYTSAGLDSSVTVNGSITTRMSHNALGNDSTITSPKGYVSYRFQNAIGQDTLLAAPFGDTTHASSFDPLYYTRTYHLYDRAGRDTSTVSKGPSVAYPSPDTSHTGADSLRVRSTYDAEGNRIAQDRKYAVSGSARTLGHTWTYDKANRVTALTTPSSSNTTHFVFDAAGNVTAKVSPRGDTAKTTYDEMNRPVRRTTPSVSFGTMSCSSALLSFPYVCYWNFPMPAQAGFCIDADTARFAYDASGQAVRAENTYARTKRAYTANGLVAYDSTNVRAYGAPGDTPCVAADPLALSGGSEWNHPYGSQHTYDLAGRLTSRTLPYHLSGCAGAGCATTYGYTNNNLTSVSDEQAGAQTLGYDGAARLTSLSYASGVTDTRSYDLESRLMGRILNITSSTPIHDSLTHDAAGHIATWTSLVSSSTASLVYGPLGAVISTYGITTSATGGAATETFVVDALGNRLRSEATNSRPAYDPDANGVRTHTISSGGQLTNSTAPTNTAGFSFDQNLAYDASGNVATTQTRHLTSGSGSLYEATINYYDGDDRLRFFNRAVGPYGNDDTHPGHRNVWEEYRYDAFGRRVLVRSQHFGGCTSTSGSSECASYVERTAWDGDAVLMEVRAPGSPTTSITAMENDASVGQASDAYPYGRVVYVHGGGLDQPLAVLRLGLQSVTDPYIVYPHTNWRGAFELGTVGDGTAASLNIAWPGGHTTADGAVATPHDGPAWFGSLVTNRTDGSGLQYLRNRYYDPATGRFTQEDPIGLAGGMNLYGFAGGDPVNFSDPFGLKACPPDCDGERGPTLGNGCPAIADHCNVDMSRAGAMAAGAVIGAAGGMAIMGGTASLAATFTTSDAISAGLVRAGGKLAGVLTAIEAGVNERTPRSALQALDVVSRAAAQVGLDAGVASRLKDGTIQLKNVGDVLTTLNTNGSILVQKGQDMILRLLH